MSNKILLSSISDKLTKSCNLNILQIFVKPMVLPKSRLFVIQAYKDLKIQDRPLGCQNQFVQIR